MQALKNRNGANVDQLCNLLKVHRRTIYRDFEILADLGFKIQKDQDQSIVRYRLEVSQDVSVTPDVTLNLYSRNIKGEDHENS